MSRSLMTFILVIICVKNLLSEVQNDRPKIKTSDGDLVLKPSYGKNLYLRTNGQGSRILFDDVDISKLNIPKHDNDITIKYSDRIAVPADIIKRLVLIEHTSIRISFLSKQLASLQFQINSVRRSSIEIASDKCYARPCENGGTCISLAVDYNCMCPSNWEGKNCDIDVNECRNFAGTDLGCQNGALCINKNGTYECLCRTGWYGIHCTRKAKDCYGGDLEMCGYGTCIPTSTGDGIKCICNQGWTSNSTSGVCDIDINECESGRGPHCSVNPKVKCINKRGSFSCGPCPPGYEGDGYICSDIDECDVLPNGGCSTGPMVPCYNTIGSRMCGPCPPGYQGDGATCSWIGSCSIDHGGCHPDAKCIENPSLQSQGAMCICPQVMDGDGFGINGCYTTNRTGSTLHCEDNPCGLHGRCHPLPRSYACFCDHGYGGAHCELSLDFCAGNPCLNGGTCKPDDAAVRGFRCECAARYTGTHCQLTLKLCGGILKTFQGNINYPDQNDTSYSHHSSCAWVIQTAINKVINVTFTKFAIDKRTNEEECANDFLQIHNGGNSGSQLVGRFCGTEYPKSGNIISSHNKLYFWFRSDHTISRGGFALHWSSIDPVCGGEIYVTSHGKISSPGWPGKYPPNRDCYWHLTTLPGKRLQLHFFQLDLELHSKCSYDFLALYDGGHTTDTLLNKYCNSSQPSPLQSSGSETLIYFHSDKFGSGDGFQMSYAAIDGTPGCGGLFTTDTGELSSPSYNGKYLNNLLCEYQIRAPPNTKIRININEFHIEPSLQCKFDYVKIYDGGPTDASLVGKFCGVSYPKSYLSSSNNLKIQFKTDVTSTEKGFKISYEIVCQQTIEADMGLISSPGYPNEYAPSRVCEYVIKTSPGKAIQLMFQDFDIEADYNNTCIYDNIEIRDGIDANSTLLGLFCGGEYLPPVQISTLNYMYIRFTSDQSYNGKGFLANFTALDTRCGGIYKETTTLISYSAKTSYLVGSDMTCTWLLIPPSDHSIKITWNDFNTVYLCRDEYVKVTDMDDNNEANSVGVYCKNHHPPATLTIVSNRLNISLHSSYLSLETAFSLSYAFLDLKTHCGGTYQRTSGIIYSPRRSKRIYSSHRNCEWVIKVPSGQQIKLNFIEFESGHSAVTDCLYGGRLYIRNGDNEQSPLIGIFCGPVIPRSLISFGNSMYLRLLDDSYSLSIRFKIEWDSSIYGCSGTLTGFKGTIASPNYPKRYSSNAECFYKIAVSSGSRIRILFTDLDLLDYAACKFEYVEIFDGRDSSANSLGKYCSMPRTALNIVTSKNYAFIKFRSSSDVGGKGFSLNYVTVCETNITESYGAIESPDYPNIYDAPSTCLWTISLLKGNRINVTITDIEINTSICTVNYLQLSEDANDNYNNRICGNNKVHFATKSNILYIKLVTRSLRYGNRFRLEWQSNGCGGYLTKDSGIIDYRNTWPNNGPLECEWVINTSPGTAIRIQFQNVYIMETQNCTKDSLEIYNGQNIHEPLVTKLCHRSSSNYKSSTNLMLLKFIKTSELRDVRFTATYWITDAECGGDLKILSGNIQSPNYPKNYDNNLNCRWYITVPQNHLIEFNILDLDLYSIPDNDNDELSYRKDDIQCEDYIKIYSKYPLISRHSQTICDQTQTRQIISKSNTLIIQFTTDDSNTAKGFKANFFTICGAQIVVNNDGILRNEKLPHISPNRSCVWTLIAEKTKQKISFTLLHMSIPRNANVVSDRYCPSSYLRLYDGDDTQAPLVHEYCGHKVPPMIVSQGSSLTIEFGSYVGTALGQFVAHYTSIDTACGGTLTSEEGSLASPNYPNAYPDSSSCDWIISTSPGNQVYLNFEVFNLEQSEYCNEDFLEIRENSGDGRIIGVYCGNNVPVNTTIASKIYLKFQSDIKGSAQGFLAHYGFIHGGEIQGVDNGEITSPLYPHDYVGAGLYTWRINTKNTTPLVITIRTLEIVTHGSQCYNALSIYDGYDDTSLLLKELCGLLDTSNNVITTSSGVAFIKLKLDESNSGSQFQLLWSTDTSRPQTSANLINCGFNSTKSILLGESVEISSPNYGHGNYKDLLKCEWVFKTTPGSHLEVLFNTFELEEISGCSSDYISIYGSYTGGLDWKPIHENVCESNITGTTLIAAKYNYMKLVFMSDSTISYRGFEGVVKAICGGVIAKSSGDINIDWAYWNNSTDYKIECNWQVKVKPGRTISVQFLSFNISKEINHCASYVKLYNGENEESPLLGKYCDFSDEIRNHQLKTSSNLLYMTYFSNAEKFQYFKIRYEENNIECGGTSQLDTDHSWETITSPNYPLAPMPFSECKWIFTGPPGEILRIDFIEIFDLEATKDCSKESVDIRDGSAETSMLKGRFCRPFHNSVKSSSNVVFIRYFTQILEPSNGFKANVSIDVCGGTLKGEKGEVLSPGYPHMQHLPPGIMCEWIIIDVGSRSISITPLDINLPKTEMDCATKITIEESVSETKDVNILKTYCNTGIFNFNTVNTLSNKISLKLTIGKLSPYTQISDYKGFRFKFESKTVRCGGDVEGSEGFITTPAYPGGTSMSYCYWIITATNSSHSIRLQLLDLSFNIKAQTIKIYDGRFKSLVQSYLINDDSYINKIFTSSGNIMSIVVSLPSYARKHRFKARFTTYELSRCGEIKSGELSSPETGQPYYCNWHYVTKNYAGTTNNISETLLGFVNISITPDNADNNCSPYTRVSISNGMEFYKDVCSSNEFSFRIPSTLLYISASQLKGTSLSFHISLNEQPCGGVINIGEEEEEVLQLPSNYNGPLDCSWVLKVNWARRIEIKIQGIFTLDCSNEFLSISERWSRSGSTMGHYCGDKPSSNEILTNFQSINVQYHSSNYVNTTNLKLFAKMVDNVCGGYLNYHSYNNIVMSPNFPKSYKGNQECSWVMITDVGYRLTLKFIERFAIEEAPNCTNDAVIIYDWINDEFTQIGKVCGRKMPPNFNSTYNKMKIVFRTNSKIHLDGFKAMWNRFCGGNYTAVDKEQFLYSPGYPNQYHNSLTCTYHITASNGHIHLQFLNFQLEGILPYCNNDNVTLNGYYRTDSVRSYLYCGNKLPASTSEFDVIDLEFKSDIKVQKKGFKISFKLFSCNFNVTNPTTIKLPPSDHALHCTWAIIAPIDKVVIVKILYIDIHDFGDCSFDNISAYDGLVAIPNKRLALICGFLNSTSVIRSLNNTMLLEFNFYFYSIYAGFAAEVYFSYSQTVGCGGEINLITSSQLIKSPLFENKKVYNNFLDCLWAVRAPINKVIQVKFTSFNISLCRNVNKNTTYDNCSCDYIEIRDGINPDSLTIGKYCGDTLPPKITSSGNHISLRLYTDDDLVSSGFTSTLTLIEPECEQSYYYINKTMQKITSPKFITGNIPRGLHCSYFIFHPEQIELHLRIISLDLLPGSVDINKCDKDRLVITNARSIDSQFMGSNLTINFQRDSVLQQFYAYDFMASFKYPKTYTFCGKHNSIDLYTADKLKIYLQTYPQTISSIHKGFEIEIKPISFLCSKNYTGTQGRIKLKPYYGAGSDLKVDCHTLITANDGDTISLYLSVVYIPSFGTGNYIEFIDGKETISNIIKNISASDYPDKNPIFSTGSNLLIHTHVVDFSFNIDMNYVTTNKGRGCGGQIHNIIGLISSPLYPEIYREEKTCEWELETPFGSRLMLHFEFFDLGSACNQNFVQLVDRGGNIYSTYCEETPADYSSADNYVKVVFKTTKNNGGTGWKAEFKAIN